MGKTNTFLATVFMMVFLILSFTVYGQTGIRNQGAIIRIDQNAIVRITGVSAADFYNTTENTIEPQIDLDGTIEMEGDWYNNSSSGVFINRDATGNLLFNGSTQQSINGTTQTSFETIELNNASGLALNSNTAVDAGLTLTSGILDVNSYTLEVGSSASISGTFSSSRMIAANGGGSLKKYIAGNGIYTFPVGDNSGTNEYTPVSFTLSSNGGLTSAWISVNLTDSKHPSDTSVSEYLTRYWTMNAGGITSPVYDVTFNYVDADIEGNEADIFNMKYDGASGTLADRVDASNNLVTFTGLSSFSDFTGAAGLVDIVPSASGTWAGQIGTTYSYTDVTIPDGITIDLTSTKASAAVKDLVIDPTGSLSVNGSLSITGNLTVNSDNTGTGSLIDKGTLSIDGEAYIKRYLATNNTTNNWRYISPSVDTALAAVVDPESAGSYLFWWDEPGDAYVEITSNSDTLENLMGYAVASSAARTLTFMGKPNSGTFSRTLTRTDLNSYEGFNLVGNPYPSTINWDTTTWNNTNLQPTIWYRTDGIFATYNKDLNAGANGGQEYIPAMQAFWVRVTDGYASGTLEANNGLRTHTRHSFYKKNNNDKQHIFRLVAENDGFTDELVIGFLDEASNYLDTYDSEKMFTSDERYVQLYTMVEGRKLVINGMKTPDQPYEVPVGIQVPKQGEYVLKASSIEQFMPELDVFLEDKYNNVRTDLREKDSYTFNSEATDTTGRFVLHFQKSATGLPGINNAANISIYSFKDKVYIDVNNPDFANSKTLVKLYNTAGQELYQDFSTFTMGENVVIPEVESGYYIVRLINGNKIRSEKIFIETR